MSVCADNILRQSLQQNLQQPVEPAPAPSPPPAPRQEPDAEPEPMEEGEEEDDDDDFLDLVSDRETGERVRPARSDRRTSPGGTPLHISPDDGEGLPDSTQQVSQPQRREETGGDNNTAEERMDDNSVDTELRPVQLTTKETFRIGLPHLQAPDLRMRYATRDGAEIRPEALFVKGVDEMSTQDVFSYFKEYDPSFIEWINDTSCNVVWLDPHSAARALLGMSRPSQSYNMLEHK